jgi:hypothetical protein
MIESKKPKIEHLSFRLKPAVIFFYSRKIRLAGKLISFLVIFFKLQNPSKVDTPEY